MLLVALEAHCQKKKPVLADWRTKAAAEEVGQREGARMEERAKEAVGVEVRVRRLSILPTAHQWRGESGMRVRMGSTGRILGGKKKGKTRRDGRAESGGERPDSWGNRLEATGLDLMQETRVWRGSASCNCDCNSDCNCNAPQRLQLPNSCQAVAVTVAVGCK